MTERIFKLKLCVFFFIKYLFQFFTFIILFVRLDFYKHFFKTLIKLFNFDFLKILKRVLILICVTCFYEFKSMFFLKAYFSLEF